MSSTRFFCALLGIFAGSVVVGADKANRETAIKRSTMVVDHSFNSAILVCAD